MARVALNQTNFSAGEFSPRIMGRTDLDRYVNGAKDLTNVYPVLHGGARRRSGTDYVTGAKSNAAASRLIPFVISADESHFVELADLIARVYDADGTFVTELATPYETADLQNVDYAQSGNVTILSNPAYPLQRMRLIDGSTWAWDEAPLPVPPIIERGQYMEDGTGFLTLSSRFTGTRTCTSLAAYWQQSDVGRKIKGGAGEAEITGFTSDTVVTVQVTTDFASVTLPAWTLIDSSPQCIIKPSAVGTLGGSITVTAAPCLNATITLSATAGAITITASAGVFAASDVGKIIYADSGSVTISGYTNPSQINGNTSSAFTATSHEFKRWGITRSAFRGLTGRNFIRVHGGLVELTTFASIGVTYNATVIKALSTADIQYPGAWELLEEYWTPHTGYPNTITFHEQRLFAGGSDEYPQTIWGSVTGIPLDFTPGVEDDDGFAFDIAADDTSRITFLSSSRTLVIHAYSGEFSAQGGVEKPITPTNIRVRQESAHGTDNVRPVLLGRESVFAQRAGKKVRSMGYRYDFDGYASPDITVLADHLTRNSGIVQMAWQQEPDSVLWCVREDGALLTCTLDRDQGVTAWAKHYTDGAFESVVCVPDGDRENVYTIVRRTVNGSTVRYIERFNDAFTPELDAPATGYPPQTHQQLYGGTVDCGKSFGDAGGATVYAVAHLIGKEVDIVADGAVMPRQTVPGSGNITLTRTAYQVLIGLPFTSRIKMLTPEIGGNFGSAQGSAMRTAEITIRFLETIGASVFDGDGNRVGDLSFVSFGPDVLDSAPALFTGLKRIEKLGWDRGRDELEIVQEQPLPMHVLSVVRKFTINEG